jgi:hypothetical protein
MRLLPQRLQPRIVAQKHDTVRTFGDGLLLAGSAVPRPHPAPGERLEDPGTGGIRPLFLPVVLPAPAVGRHAGPVPFLAAFQHTNIRTPQWLGYIVQWAESHSVHHARGIHHYNHSDLPLFHIFAAGQRVRGLQQLVHHQDIDIPVSWMPKRGWKTSNDFKS